VLKIGLSSINLTSIFDKRINEELLYQKDERSWMGQDVVIFPVVGRLKSGSYLYDDKEYFMKNHGLIRYNNLDVISHEKDKVILGFKYNTETLLSYPFKFYFEISYYLNNDSLEIEYRVVNLDNKVIYSPNFNGFGIVKGNCNVVIDSSTINGNVFGGGNNGVTYGNVTTKINNSTVNGDIFGGANQADVEGNVSLKIEGGNYNNIFGGNNLEGNIKDDKIEIEILNYLIFFCNCY
jgi:hypothetical protein